MVGFAYSRKRKFYMNKRFSEVACIEENKDLWDKCTERLEELYKKPNDVRNPFERDYTRILHSYAYRRLKHKTQVFYDINNEHICTRMEHVSHVDSVSSTIAKELGLNTELTKAIAIGHDIGHAPFGHQGEKVLDSISKEHLGTSFWHERNGLRFVDDIELLVDPYNEYKNLALTYAVRDGIISHCGEEDINGISPRNEYIDLFDSFNEPGQYAPFTWEGCVVKIADKIAYIGRDIEDATTLGFLDEESLSVLREYARKYDQNAINTTIIMSNLISDICKNSSVEKGICMSDEEYQMLTDLKMFNLEHIYKHKWFNPYIEYTELVINTIFNTLFILYDGKHTFEAINGRNVNSKLLRDSFVEWLSGYVDYDIVPKENKEEALMKKNNKIYSRLDSEKIYAQAIIDYISSMSDRFAVRVYNELTSYG